MIEKIRTYIKSLTPKQKKIWLGVIVFFALISIVMAISDKKPLTDAEVITKVSMLTAVPNPNEDMPAIYTIADPAKMPAFFKGSQPGDITLLYLKSQLAVVYSPSRNIIVNKGPIINDAQQEKVVKSTTTETIKSTSTATSTR